MSESAEGLSFIAHVRRVLAVAGLVAPRAGEVSVVLFDTSRWGTFEAEAALLLASGERERAARFRFDHDRCAYVLAHALWRVVLAVCLEREPDEVPLAFLPSGQPHLPGAPWATSLSHSGSMTLVAAGAARMLGVDIERWPPRASLDELLPVICTPTEAHTVGALPPASRERALLQLWTRKEALLKAFGTGLARAPATFCASLGEPVTFPSTLGGSACRVIDLVLPGACLGALAVSLDVARYRTHLAGEVAGAADAGAPRVHGMSP